MRARLGRRAMGVAFVAVNLGLVALSLAVYLKVFSSDVQVTLLTDRVGNQLQKESDVKVRGVIVGVVRDVRPTADGAEVELAIDPDKVALVPDNVSARLTPKTLFGERFVDLVIPERPSGRALAAGDVIPQDRSQTAIELERILDNLLPLLQAVEPHKLASTLGAIDQALAGRGEQLGATLVEMQRYVSALNPSLPDLQANLSELADATATLDRAAPDLLAALANFSGTSQTIVMQQLNLQRLYTSVSTASGDLLQFLAANRDNIIDLADTSRPTLELLAEYAPGYECFFRTMAGLVPRVREAFGEGQERPALRLTLEVAPDRGKYVPNRDEPEFTDRRGPACYQPVAPPDKFPQYPGGVPQDGAEHPPPPRGQGSPVPGGAGDTGGAGDAGAPTGLDSISPLGAGVPAIDGWDLGIANSPTEAQLVAALKAHALGLDPNDVPRWSTLLLGPTLRDTKVTVEVAPR